MNLLNIHERRREDRKFLELTDKDEILRIIDKHLKKSKVMINDFPKDIHAKLEIIKSSKDIHLSLNKLLTKDYDLDTREYLTLYSETNRYIEILLKRGFFDGQCGFYDIIKAKIAHNHRLDNRISLNNPEIQGENFIIGQHYFHPDMDQSPDIVQQTFKELKLSTRKDFLHCEFIQFDKNLLGRDIQAVINTGKPIYIEDTRKGLNNQPPNSDFLDFKKHLGSLFTQELELLKTKRIRSLLVLPIKYKNLFDQESIIGFFKMSYATEIIPKTMITRLYDFSELITEKVKEMNIKKFNIKQSVIDISVTGLKLSINDQLLAQSIISNPEEIQFDLNIDPKTKFTLYCKAMNMITAENNSFHVGFQILGLGNKFQDINDWHEFVNQRIN